MNQRRENEYDVGGKRRATSIEATRAVVTAGD